MKALAKHPRQLAKEPAGTWFGLRFGDRSTHTSRTKIFSELAELLKFVLASAHCDAFGTVIGPAGRSSRCGWYSPAILGYEVHPPLWPTTSG
jgi:hypothetical protein